MTSGPGLRDEGHARVLAASSDWWVSCCRQAITHLAAVGKPFTVDHIRAYVPEPHHPNAWGAQLRHAALRDEIRAVGFIPAHRAESRGRVVRVWQGVA